MLPPSMCSVFAAGPLVRVLPLFLLAAAAALGPPALQAQQRPPTVALHSTYLSAGRMGVDLDYVGHKTGRQYAFEGHARTLAVGSEDAQLLLGYGTNEAANGATVRLYEAALAAGGNAFIVRDFMQSGVGAFVPIRLNVGYRGVQPGAASGSADDPDRLHLALGALSVGWGLKARSPRQLPGLEDRLVVLLWRGYGVGGYGDADTGFDDSGLMGLREFNLDARIEGLFGARAGLVIGYTQRGQYLGQGDFEGAAQVLEAFARPADLALKHTQRGVRIGLCF